MRPYITGPAALKIGSGPYIFSAEGFSVALKTNTGKIMSDLHGELGNFEVSRMVTITAREVGRISSALLTALFPFGAGNIGGSCLTSADVAVEIWTLAGQKITWKAGGITKFPELTLSATKPLFSGDFAVTCLGAATTSMQTDPEAAAHWNAITSTAYVAATTGFDPTSIKRYLYTAAYGDTPYDAMTAQEGFKVSLAMETEALSDDNVGVADILIKSFSASCSFTPSNLTEAQIWTLLNLQNTGALQPGMLIGGGGTDLVITGADADTGFSLTLSSAGFSDAALKYASGKLRAGDVMAMASRTFTTGAPNPLWTFVVS